MINLKNDKSKKDNVYMKIKKRGVNFKKGRVKKKQ